MQIINDVYAQKIALKNLFYWPTKGDSHVEREALGFDSDRLPEEADFQLFPICNQESFQLDRVKSVVASLVPPQLRSPVEDYVSSCIRLDAQIGTTAKSVALKGESGTGKSSLAKAISGVLLELKIVESSISMERHVTDASVAIAEAKGGVLIIDEADLIDESLAESIVDRCKESRTERVMFILLGNPTKLTNMFEKEGALDCQFEKIEVQRPTLNMLTDSFMERAGCKENLRDEVRETFKRVQDNNFHLVTKMLEALQPEVSSLSGESFKELRGREWYLVVNSG